MNILLVTPSYKPAYVYGGPTVSIGELAEALVSVGHAVTIYTTTANGKEELDVDTTKPQWIDGVQVYYFKRQTGDHTHVSFGLWKKLWTECVHFDIIHLQSWWSILIIVAAKICRIKRRRYIVSPRGMLSWYSFQNQHGFAKKLVHNLGGKTLLKKSYLHATTDMEWKDCRQIHPSWKGFVLPNLVRFPSATAYEIEKVNRRLTFGFLSRIDQKKGLELLFEALSKVPFDYQLMIAGTGESNYVLKLKEFAAQLGIEGRLTWCGWKNGEDKFEFLQSIDVFVLTSYNENFANTVIESLVIGTPVLVSNGVGLAGYVEKNKLGWVCDATIPSIVASLNTIHKEKSNLSSIREEAPALVRKDFDKKHLAEQYSKAYSDIIKPGL